MTKISQNAQLRMWSEGDAPTRERERERRRERERDEERDESDINRDERETTKTREGGERKRKICEERKR